MGTKSAERGAATTCGATTEAVKNATITSGNQTDLVANNRTDLRHQASLGGARNRAHGEAPNPVANKVEATTSHPNLDTVEDSEAAGPNGAMTADDLQASDLGAAAFTSAETPAS